MMAKREKGRKDSSSPSPLLPPPLKPPKPPSHPAGGGARGGGGIFPSASSRHAAAPHDEEALARLAFRPRAWEGTPGAPHALIIGVDQPSCGVPKSRKGLPRTHGGTWVVTRRGGAKWRGIGVSQNSKGRRRPLRKEELWSRSTRRVAPIFLCRPSPAWACPCSVYFLHRAPPPPLPTHSHTLSLLFFPSFPHLCVHALGGDDMGQHFLPSSPSPPPHTQKYAECPSSNLPLGPHGPPPRPPPGFPRPSHWPSRPRSPPTLFPAAPGLFHPRIHAPPPFAPLCPPVHGAGLVFALCPRPPQDL